MNRSWYPIAPLLGAALLVACASGPAAVPAPSGATTAQTRAAGDAWREGLPATRAERSGYTETSTHADMLEFLSAVQAADSARGGPSRLHRTSMGRSGEGRDLALVVLSRPLVKSAEEARGLGRPVVYLQGNIHGGEVEGKETAQALIRDLAFDPRPNVLDSIVLLVLPIYNADGNERFGPQESQRGSQRGPAIVGQRPNSQGLDLNRDYVKAEAPETRAALRMLAEWDPHVFVDMHTTNGSYHGYALTYSPSLSPTAVFAAPFTTDSLLPVIRERTRARHQVETFDYGNFPDRDPTDTVKTRWATYDSRPRFGTNYMGLRGRVSILSEAYSHDVFERRVEATDVFVREILSLVAERRRAVLDLARRADSAAVAWGRDPSRAPMLSLRSELTRSPDTVAVVHEVVVRTGDSLRTEAGVPPGLRRTGRFISQRMPVQLKFDPVLERRLPVAYALSPQDTAALRLLALHGVRTEVVREPITGSVERFAIAGIARAEQPFQGHRETTLQGTWRTEQGTVPASWHLVRTAQPLGVLAFFLLEPESEDGLVTWSVFEGRLAEGRDYPVIRLLAPAR